MEVAGAIVGKNVLNSTATIDFLTGNIQYTNANCGLFNLHNMKNGAAYTFVVKGTTTNTCSFLAFSGAGTGSITVHLPPYHGATVSGKHTIYNFMVANGDVYVAWAPGY